VIVYNFPDKCPSCGSEDIVPAMVDPGGGVEIPAGRQPFMCKACNVMWSEHLVTSKDWSCFICILADAWMLPKGILVNTRLNDPRKGVRALLGIPDKGDHIVIPLQKVLDDGNEQAELIRKGVKKIWTPPSSG